jgi:hypothetical protein
MLAMAQKTEVLAGESRKAAENAIALDPYLAPYQHVIQER